MSIRLFTLAAVPLLAGSVPLHGQRGHAATAAAAGDAAWTRAFAVPFRPDAAPEGQQGDENRIVLDPRFEPLLKASFPQRQWFWYEHGRLISTADLVETFIGVPGDALVDENRYVTADGCVPHDCSADRGMLWMDTGTHPATLIFASVDSIGGSGAEESYHMWIFSSTRLNWQHLPPSFLISLPRWLTTIARPGYKGTSGYHYNFALATIVQPSGVMEDISPSTLPLGPSATTGAKQ